MAAPSPEQPQPNNQSNEQKLHLRLVDENYVIEPDFDDGDGGGDDKLTITFSGKAREEIIRSAERAGVNVGDFVRLSVKMGITATRQGKFL